MSGDLRELKHSVAFRVNEDEWRMLTAAAEKAGTTVPQLAKQILFARVGIDYLPKRRVYGQVKQ